jgi:hypothetical protein
VTPASTWIITVPSTFGGRRPNVQVFLTNGEEVWTDMTVTSAVVSITFPVPTAGSAVLT